MFQRLQKRSAEEEGFTLIELMVVVLIIGILIAIALPTFLGARERAQDKAAQSSLRNALVAAKTIFTDNDDFSGVTLLELDATEPTLTYSVDPSTDAKEIAWALASTNGLSDNEYGSAALADTGTCWFLRDVSAPAQSAGTYYGTSAVPANCTGLNGVAATVIGSKW